MSYYNPHKATQAVAYLVSLNGGTMNLWRMLKLIYLFDRESLVQTGSTITGDSLDNLPHGGTPSQIYDNTKSKRDERFKDAVWQEYLTESVNNEVKLKGANFSTSKLSQFERDLIKSTWETSASCRTESSTSWFTVCRNSKTRRVPRRESTQKKFSDTQTGAKKISSARNAKPKEN